MNRNNQEYRTILVKFIKIILFEQSSQKISIRTSPERQRIMRVLTEVRRVLTKDVPEIFSGTVE